MDTALEPVTVLADRLQAEGDPRGELLALELAAAHAPTVAESQRLNRAAQSLRSAAIDLAWPPQLSNSHGLIRAGLLVSGSWIPRTQPDLPASLGPYCRALVVPVDRGRLGLDALAAAEASVGLHLDELHEELMGAQMLLRRPHRLSSVQALTLPTLGLTRGLHSVASLARLHGLTSLNLGPHGRPEDLFEGLFALDLRSLSVRIDTADQLRKLLNRCAIEHLRIFGFAGAFEHRAELDLRSLTLDYFFGEPGPGRRLADDLSLPQLESLSIRGAAPEDLDQVAALGIRRLTLVYPNEPIVDVIRKLSTSSSLEHLSVRLKHNIAVDPAPLSNLRRLRSLELIGRFEGDLEVPDSLERLVLLGNSTRVRVHGQVPHVCVPVAALAEVLGRLELERTTTVSVHAWSTDDPLLAEFFELCPQLETLVLEGGHDNNRTIQALQKLPTLRTLVWPAQSIRQQRATSERLPHVQIVGADPPRLRKDWPEPTSFDPRAPSTWPKSG